jgi:hypothetical protein
MTKLTVLSVAAAVLGKAIASEDDALIELNGLGPQLVELRAAQQFQNVLSAELDNEKDPVKAAAKIRELKSSVQQSQQAAAEQKKTAIKTSVDATLEKHKNKLTVPMRELMHGQLTTELEAGTKLEETKTVKALESMKSLSIFEQHASGDTGAAGAEDDDKLEATAQELLRNEPDLVAQAKGDSYGAYMKALERADRKLKNAAR